MDTIKIHRTWWCKDMRAHSPTSFPVSRPTWLCDDVNGNKLHTTAKFEYIWVKVKMCMLFGRVWIQFAKHYDVLECETFI